MSRRDRRQAQRTPTNLVLEFYDCDDVLKQGEGRLINVSAIGALIETLLPLLRGQVIWLRLRLDGYSVLDTPAKVTRIGSTGLLSTYGVAFMDLSKVNIERLKGMEEYRAA